MALPRRGVGLLSAASITAGLAWHMLRNAFTSTEGLGGDTIAPTPLPYNSTPVPSTVPIPTSSPEDVCGFHTPLVVYYPSPAPAQVEITTTSPDTSAMDTSTLAWSVLEALKLDSSPATTTAFPYALELVFFLLGFLLPTPFSRVLAKIREKKWLKVLTGILHVTIPEIDKQLDGQGTFLLAYGLIEILGICLYALFSPGVLLERNEAPLLANALGRNRRLRLALADRERDVANRDNRIATLELKLQEANDKAKSAISQCNKAKTEKTNLENYCIGKETSRRKYGDDLESMKKEHAQATTELKELEMRVDERQRSSDTLDSFIASKNKQIRERYDELATFRKDIDNAKQELKDLTAKTKEAQEARSQAETPALEAESSNNSNDIDMALRDQIHQLRKAKAASEWKAWRVQNEMVQLNQRYILCCNGWMICSNNVKFCRGKIHELEEAAKTTKSRHDAEIYRYKKALEGKDHGIKMKRLEMAANHQEALKKMSEMENRLEYVRVEDRKEFLSLINNYARLSGEDRLYFLAHGQCRGGKDLEDYRIDPNDDSPEDIEEESDEEIKEYLVNMRERQARQKAAFNKRSKVLDVPPVISDLESFFRNASIEQPKQVNKTPAAEPSKLDSRLLSNQVSSGDEQKKPQKASEVSTPAIVFEQGSSGCSPVPCNLNANKMNQASKFDRKPLKEATTNGDDAQLRPLKEISSPSSPLVATSARPDLMISKGDLKWPTVPPHVTDSPFKFDRRSLTQFNEMQSTQLTSMREQPKVSSLPMSSKVLKLNFGGTAPSNIAETSTPNDDAGSSSPPQEVSTGPVVDSMSPSHKLTGATADDSSASSSQSKQSAVADTSEDETTAVAKGEKPVGSHDAGEDEKTAGAEGEGPDGSGDEEDTTSISSSDLKRHIKSSKKNKRTRNKMKEDAAADPWKYANPIILDTDSNTQAEKKKTQQNVARRILRAQGFRFPGDP